MKRFIPLVLIAAMIACWNAPRDNRYDPRNPDKAQITGQALECDNAAVSGAIIELLQNGVVLKTDTCNASGGFEIDNIDPGIYKILANARYFNPIEVYPESLWANTERAYSITFHTYHFEDDPDGTASPYGFEPENGTWRVTDEFSNPHAHSTPHVYRGDQKDTTGFALTLCEKNLKNLFIKANMIVNDSSSAEWKAGVIFRYRNAYNYYLMQVTHDTVSFIRVLNDTLYLRKMRPLYFPVGTWSTISLRCKEDSTFCYINDIYQFGVLDSSFVDGRFGFMLTNGNPDSLTSVNFDDVMIYPDFPDTL